MTAVNTAGMEGLILKAIEWEGAGGRPGKR
jgi:hypothetical protein